MRKASDFKVRHHGIEYDQYWQGAGISFSRWTDCATGIGDCNAAAFEDALDLLGQSGWDTEALESQIRAEIGALVDEVNARKPDILPEDCHYYVTIYVKE